MGLSGEPLNRCCERKILRSVKSLIGFAREIGIEDFRVSACLVRFVWAAQLGTEAPCGIALKPQT
jgi:hypothetical protein